MQKRKNLLVNWRVQGPILIRLVVHVVTFAAVLLSLVILCWIYQRSVIESAFGPNSEPLHAFWYRFLPIAGCSLALAPFAILDLLRITNRIAGPIHRFEETMKEFEETGVMPKASLRENDLLIDFCGRFNQLVDEMHKRFPETAAESQQTTTAEESCEHTAKTEESVLV